MSVLGIATYGSPEDLDYLLETQEMTEQELRAAIQNVLKYAGGLEARIARLESTTK
jgi:hypothetical protein